MSDTPRISPKRGTPRVALPQLEQLLAVRQISRSRLMAHLGLKPQNWASNLKAGGWTLPDAERIAAFLDVPLDVLKARGVPDASPAVQSLLLQPAVATATDAAVADITRRMEHAFAQVMREAVALLASGVVSLPAPNDPKVRKLRELTTLVDAETVARRAPKTRAK